MPRAFTSLAAAAAMAGLFTATAVAQTAPFSAEQQTAIEKIMREYLISHPEVLQEAVAELEKRQSMAEAGKSKAAIAEHRDALLHSPRQVTLGNPDGDVTLVEFFDYNCGYCKHALGDMMTFLKNDPKLRVVLKEFPVLGPGSVEAAQIAVAMRMQDKSGKKYLDFHQKLLGGRGQADRAKALTAAKEAGADMARLEKDSKSPEVRETLDESMKLAEALGINGTPSYVIGDKMLPGAVGLPALKDQIAASR
jgi:protein-disulfide isomerase